MLPGNILRNIWRRMSVEMLGDPFTLKKLVHGFYLHFCFVEDHSTCPQRLWRTFNSVGRSSDWSSLCYLIPILCCNKCHTARENICFSQQIVKWFINSNLPFKSGQGYSLSFGWRGNTLRREFWICSHALPWWVRNYCLNPTSCSLLWRLWEPWR